MNSIDWNDPVVGLVALCSVAVLILSAAIAAGVWSMRECDRELFFITRDSIRKKISRFEYLLTTKFGEKNRQTLLALQSEAQAFEVFKRDSKAKWSFLHDKITDFESRLDKALGIPDEDDEGYHLAHEHGPERFRSWGAVDDFPLPDKYP